MSTYVIAGATGRVGGAVADELLRGGEKVSIIVREPGRASALIARGASAAVGTLEDAVFLTRTLTGAKAFFAILPEDPAAQDFHGVRERIVHAIATAVRDSKVPHIVAISAPLAIFASGNGPARDLHKLEHALRSTGANVTILRPSFYQDYVAMAIPPAMHAGIYPNALPSADIAIPTIATRDVGRIAAAALRSPSPRSEIVDLTGPEYSTRQLADALGAALGRKLEVVNIPPAAQAESLVRAGMSTSFANALAEMWECAGSQSFAPQGDRSERGSTRVEDILPAIVARATAQSG